MSKSDKMMQKKLKHNIKVDELKHPIPPRQRPRLHKHIPTIISAVVLIALLGFGGWGFASNHHLSSHLSHHKSVPDTTWQIKTSTHHNSQSISKNSKNKVKKPVKFSEIKHSNNINAVWLAKHASALDKVNGYENLKVNNRNFYNGSKDCAKSGLQPKFMKNKMYKIGWIAQYARMYQVAMTEQNIDQTANLHNPYDDHMGLQTYHYLVQFINQHHTKNMISIGYDGQHLNSRYLSIRNNNGYEAGQRYSFPYRYAIAWIKADN